MIEDEDRAGRARTGVAADDGEAEARSEAPAVPSAVPPTGAMTGADFQTYIGRGLRAVYDDVAKQPVPDRFLELMKKLG